MPSDTTINLEQDPNEEIEWYVKPEVDIDEDYKAGPRTYDLTPSAFTEFAIYMPLKGEYANFSFEGRKYLRQIYDTPSDRRIIVAGRQVEKTLVVNSLILLEDGSYKTAGSVQIGDRLACLSMPLGAKTTSGVVSWVSRRYTKPCVRIKTRQGHVCEVAETHPMRLWGAWVEAAYLDVGVRLAVLRRGGQFDSESTEAGRIELTAYMIADGGVGGSSIRITKGAGLVQDELLRLLRQVGAEYTELNGSVPNFYIKRSRLHDWLQEDGLLGCLSAEKFVPDWVFKLSKEDTALFLNRLWACDGHVKKVSNSKYDLVYSSISLRLVRQVQALLWKFGIPTKYRSYVPEVYEGTDKVHHMLRVETSAGIRTFLTEIGALGKSEDVPLPEAEENNNHDTYPQEGINDLLERICRSKPGNRKAPWRGRFYAAGLRRTLKYAPTKSELEQYLAFFEEEGGFDSSLLEELRAHIDTDIYWDEVEEIEDIGEQECVDFMVEDHHNFIADGFITHNSTLLGNQIISYCILNPGFRALYVSPSHQQTKVFSRDRIKEPIEVSPILKSFTNPKIANILERKFINRSQVTLRFAFLNADRCIVGSSLVQLADGQVAPIRDLVGRGPVEIVAVDEQKRVVRAYATNARNTGVRDVMRVRTSLLLPLLCTPDHRILTDRGWVEAQHLVKGDRVASLVRDSDPRVCWVAVSCVEPAGRDEVFDLTVEGPECFQANGIIVHNCRGIPADYVLVDEFQDIILENVPVIEECASHSNFKLFTYSGTPKSLDNPLEHYYRRFSTQNEWVVPCRAHGTPKNASSWHWNVLTEDNVGKDGLICDSCKKLIDPGDPDAEWASMNPNPLVEKPYEGFRIPQIMVPWISWPDILDKQRKYSRAKFHNEVLGLSFDSGVRPLTQADVKDNCNSELSMSHYRLVAERYKGDVPIFMGIDWGCHDEQTRILTKDGFKYFADLTDADEVAQFDKDTREMSFVKPIARTIRDWDGDLLHFQGRSLDMMLTGTHRMLVRGKKSKGWHVETADQVAERMSQVMLRGGVWWAGEEEDRFTLPGLPSSAGYKGCESKTFLMDDWLEFLGYYLSEGGLCLKSNAAGETRPYCIKLSQRESVNAEKAQKIRACMRRLGLDYQEYPNEKTGDVNWTLCGKQFWAWVEENVGSTCDTKRIPRKVLDLSARQLRILFESMMLGDGGEDSREGNFNGHYNSTSKGLCEDYQELCIRLGLRSTLSLARPAEGNKKAYYRVSWSAGDDHAFNAPSERIQKVPYKGKVYCCKVPDGFIVTERNGRIAYQGNSGEGAFTVVVLGAYLPWAPERFTVFFAHRFEGPESEPRRQLDIIKGLINDFNVAYVGTDYGMGHWPNDELLREYGFQKIKKYQWVGNVKKKISYETKLTIPRFLCHRTEIMSDIFNAIKRRDVFSFPRWQEFQEPFAADMLNIFSEFNERLRMNVYKHAPGMPDDTFHALVFCFLVSFHYKRRPDVVAPVKEAEREAERASEKASEREELDIDD